jgi:hypothetical protein
MIQEFATPLDQRQESQQPLSNLHHVTEPISTNVQQQACVDEITFTNLEQPLTMLPLNEHQFTGPEATPSPRLIGSQFLNSNEHATPPSPTSQPSPRQYLPNSIQQGNAATTSPSPFPSPAQLQQHYNDQCPSHHSDHLPSNANPNENENIDHSQSSPSLLSSPSLTSPHLPSHALPLSPPSPPPAATMNPPANTATPTPSSNSNLETSTPNPSNSIGILEQDIPGHALRVIEERARLNKYFLAAVNFFYNLFALALVTSVWLKLRRRVEWDPIFVTLFVSVSLGVLGNVAKFIRVFTVSPGVQSIFYHIKIQNLFEKKLFISIICAQKKKKVMFH